MSISSRFTHRSLSTDINRLHITIAIDHFQSQIFKHISGEAQAKVDFAVGELCLVFCSVVRTKSLELFRGRVTAVENDLTYKVYLIDKGIEVKVGSQEIFRISEHIAKQPPAAIKMHLHGLIPTGCRNGKWSLTSIDHFRHTVNSYATKFISIVGDANEAGSVPALLWGITTEKICAKKEEKFHNINDYLIELGVVDHTRKPEENFPELERDIVYGENGLEVSGSSIHQENAPSRDHHESKMEMIGNVPTDVSPKLICSWTAEKNYNNEIFLGSPSHIQNDGMIYIQNEKQKAIRKDLEEKLLKVYSSIPRDHYNVVLKLGQPVIARSPFKSGYYRGVVKSLQKNSKDGFQIKFIDYGTIEILQRDDIYASVIAANIPILTGQYRLGSVIPLENSWPASTIDLIHSKIVGSRVMVTVKNEANRVKSCSIAAIDDDGTCTDIEKLLTEQELAKWGVPQQLALPANPEKESSGATLIDVFNRNEHDEFKIQLKCQKLEEIVKTFDLPDFVTASVEETKIHLRSKNEDIDDESNNFFEPQPPYTQFDSQCQNTSTPYSFDDKKSLSHPRRGIRNLPKIRFFDLQGSEIDRFECVFANAFNLKIYVTPLIPELSDQIQKLNQKLRECDESSLKKFSESEKSIGKFALVKNSQSSFQRGFVISLSSNKTSCNVFLQDSALIKQYKMKKVFKIPKTLLKYPKQTLALNMNGLKINPNAGDSHDIYKHLQAHLQGETFRAVVRGFDDKNYPSVDLFDKTGKLAYQNLIDKNYFVKC